jgi:hypothetical protein
MTMDMIKRVYFLIADSGLSQLSVGPPPMCVETSILVRLREDKSCTSPMLVVAGLCFLREEQRVYTKVKTGL